MSIQPGISVIMPTFNRASVIKESIVKVLAQEYGDFELIIIDDGSTDDTDKVIKSFKDNRIIYLKQANKGSAAARNLGLKSARGEYIAYCDDDDYLYPNHLKVLAGHLNAFPNVGLVYGNCMVVDTKWVDWNKKPIIRDNFLDYANLHDLPHEAPIVALLPDYSKKLLEMTCIFTPLTVMHRRKLIDRTGGFPDDKFYCANGDDWNLWLKFSRITKCLHINEIVGEYHYHHSSVFRNKEKFWKLYFGLKKTIMEEKYKNNKDKYLKGIYLYYIAECLNYLGQIDESMVYYKKALEAKSAFQYPIIKLFEYYLNSGDKGKAKRYVGMFNGNYAQLYNLGKYYFMVKDYKKSVSFLEKAANLYPLDHMLFYQLGEGYFKIGDYKKALLNYVYAKEILACIDLDFLYWVIQKIGLCYITLGRYAEALEAIFGLKENFERCFMRGKCFYELGESKRAMENLSKAKLLWNRQHHSFQELAEINKIVGHLERK